MDKKNKLKALSQLLGKLADKALASLPGIIGSIISWISNQSSDILQHSQNRPTGDRWLKF